MLPFIHILWARIYISVNFSDPFLVTAGQLKDLYNRNKCRWIKDVCEDSWFRWVEESFNYCIFSNEVTKSVIGIDYLSSAGLGQWAIFGNLSDLKCYFSQKHTNSNRKQGKSVLLRAHGNSTVGFPATMANAVSCTVGENRYMRTRFINCNCGLVAIIALFSYRAAGQPYKKTFCSIIIYFSLVRD